MNFILDVRCEELEVVTDPPRMMWFK